MSRPEITEARGGEPIPLGGGVRPPRIEHVPGKRGKGPLWRRAWVGWTALSLAVSAGLGVGIYKAVSGQESGQNPVDTTGIITTVPTLPENTTIPPVSTTTTQETTTTTERIITGRISVEGNGLTEQEISDSNKDVSNQLNKLLPALERKANAPGAKSPNYLDYTDVIDEISQDNRLEKKTTTDFIDPSDPVKTIKDIEDAWISGQIRTASLEERWYIGRHPGFLTRWEHMLNEVDPDTGKEYGIIIFYGKPLLLIESGEEAALLLGCEYVDGSRFTVAVRLPQDKTIMSLYKSRDAESSTDNIAIMPKKPMLKNYESLIKEERTMGIIINYSKVAAEASAKALEEYKGFFDNPVRLKAAELFNEYMFAAEHTDNPETLPKPFFINPDPEILSESTIWFLPATSSLYALTDEVSTDGALFTLK